MKEGGRETKNTVLVHTNIEMGIVTVDNGATTTVTAKASWTTTTAPHIPVDGKRASSKAGALSHSLLETTIPDSGRAAKCTERGLLPKMVKLCKWSSTTASSLLNDLHYE
jgi:hypothetical protein